MKNLAVFQQAFKYLLSILLYLSQMACQCYSHLPCLGGLLDRGVGAGRAEGWTNQIHCLLASASNQLAQIYQGAEMGTISTQHDSLIFSIVLSQY